MGKKRFDYEKYNKDKEEARKFFNKLLGKAKEKGNAGEAKKQTQEIELIWAFLTFIFLIIIVLNNTLFTAKTNREIKLMPMEVKVTGEVLGIAFIFFLFIYILIAFFR